MIDWLRLFAPYTAIAASIQSRPRYAALAALYGTGGGGGSNQEGVI